jgi:polyhydroxyalkanoate synthesis regulator phasin
MSKPPPPTPPWLAWTAVFFGSLGILLCLAAIGVIIIVSSHIQTSVNNVFTEVSSLLSSVRQTSTEVTANIATSRNAIAEIDQGIDEKITRLANNADINSAELETLFGKITSISQRLRDWLTLFDSAQQLSRLVEELIDATLIFSRSDDQTRQDILSALENGKAQLEESIAAFDDLMIQWEKIRHDPDEAPPTRPLFNRIDTALALVEEYTAAFTSDITKLKDATDDLQSRLKRRIFFGTLIISALLVWQAVAQYCLARWGWQRKSTRRIAP